VTLAAQIFSILRRTLNLLEIFLPQVSGLVLRRVLFGDQYLVIFTASLARRVNCPICQTPSERVHSYYTRRVVDIPWAEAQVQIFIEVRRFYCLNQKCNRQTFAERLGPAIPAFARRTQRLTNQLEALGLALGGEAAARLAKKLGLVASPDTILNLVRTRVLPQVAKVRVLGVDEFSFRRGYNYGTILVDLERHEVIELLPDIKKETLIEWLKTLCWLPTPSEARMGLVASTGVILICLGICCASVIEGISIIPGNLFVFAGIYAGTSYTRTKSSQPALISPETFRLGCSPSFGYRASWVYQFRRRNKASIMLVNCFSGVRLPNTAVSS
jgi:hypothetical protein